MAPSSIFPRIYVDGYADMHLSPRISYTRQNGENWWVNYRPVELLLAKGSRKIETNMDELVFCSDLDQLPLIWDRGVYFYEIPVINDSLESLTSAFTWTISKIMVGDRENVEDTVNYSGLHGTPRSDFTAIFRLMAAGETEDWYTFGNNGNKGHFMPRIGPCRDDEYLVITAGTLESAAQKAHVRVDVCKEGTKYENHVKYILTPGTGIIIGKGRLFRMRETSGHSMVVLVHHVYMDIGSERFGPTDAEICLGAHINSHVDPQQFPQQSGNFDKRAELVQYSSPLCTPPGHDFTVELQEKPVALISVPMKAGSEVTPPYLVIGESYKPRLHYIPFSYLHKLLEDNVFKTIKITKRFPPYVLRLYDNMNKREAIKGLQESEEQEPTSKIRTIPFHHNGLEDISASKEVTQGNANDIHISEEPPGSKHSKSPVSAGSVPKITDKSSFPVTAANSINTGGLPPTIGKAGGIATASGTFSEKIGEDEGENNQDSSETSGIGRKSNSQSIVKDIESIVQTKLKRYGLYSLARQYVTVTEQLENEERFLASSEDRLYVMNNYIRMKHWETTTLGENLPDEFNFCKGSSSNFYKYVTGINRLRDAGVLDILAAAEDAGYISGMKKQVLRNVAGWDCSDIRNIVEDWKVRGFDKVPPRDFMFRRTDRRIVKNKVSVEQNAGKSP